MWSFRFWIHSKKKKKRCRAAADFNTFSMDPWMRFILSGARTRLLSSWLHNWCCHDDMRLETVSCIFMLEADKSGAGAFSRCWMRRKGLEVMRASERAAAQFHGWRIKHILSSTVLQCKFTSILFDCFLEIVPWSPLHSFNSCYPDMNHVKQRIERNNEVFFWLLIEAQNCLCVNSFISWY